MALLIPEKNRLWASLYFCCNGSLKMFSVWYSSEVRWEKTLNVLELCNRIENKCSVRDFYQCNSLFIGVSLFFSKTSDICKQSVEEGFIYISLQNVLLPGDWQHHCIVEKALPPQFFWTLFCHTCEIVSIALHSWETC